MDFWAFPQIQQVPPPPKKKKKVNNFIKWGQKMFQF